MLFQKKKNAIVVGCGRFGSGVAGVLSDRGYDVIIIDKDESAFRKLPLSFDGHKIVGDATNIDLLESVNIKSMLMVVAVTNSDNVNSLIAQIACRIYGVDKVFARFADIEKEHIVRGFPIDAIYPYILSMNEFEKISGIKDDDE